MSPRIRSVACRTASFRLAITITRAFTTPKDNKIGDINDLLLDKEGKVSAVILGVGGFLGAGEKNVAVPFNALKLTEKNGKRYLVMDTTKEALNSAPGYTFDRTKKEWIPAKKG